MCAQMCTQRTRGRIFRCFLGYSGVGEDEEQVALARDLFADWNAIEIQNDLSGRPCLLTAVRP